MAVQARWHRRARVSFGALYERLAEQAGRIIRCGAVRSWFSAAASRAAGAPQRWPPGPGRSRARVPAGAMPPSMDRSRPLKLVSPDRARDHALDHVGRPCLRLDPGPLWATRPRRASACSGELLCKRLWGMAALSSSYPPTSHKSSAELALGPVDAVRCFQFRRHGRQVAHPARKRR
jgi:hypothetical protein